jgi:acyl-CoA synthetase (AMP-forming)/AMP-acid ligase II
VNVGHMAEGLRYRFLKITKEPVHVRSAADWARIEAPAGQVGELIVSGEHVCRDYYNDPGAFERAKLRDENGDVWHRTGDLGRLDAHGSLWIVGRVHNAIHRDGAAVFPVRAEIILKKLPFTRHAAYLGLPDARRGERAACVIVPRDPESLADPAELGRREAELKRIMTKNGMPVDQVLFRAEIPMDPRHHSKVEYDALRAQLEKEES